MRWKTLARALIAFALLPGSLIMAQELKPGDLAPDFSLAGSDGKLHKLSYYRDKQVVVLAWFPKAFTGG